MELWCLCVHSTAIAERAPPLQHTALLRERGPSVLVTGTRCVRRRGPGTLATRSPDMRRRSPGTFAAAAFPYSFAANTRRNPSSVNSLFVTSMLLQSGAMRAASPPVATTVAV